MHYMICVSGFAGAGKDECAGQLVREHHALQTGLADPGKRHMADAYGFNEQQLFGPSPFRNAGDVRIPKNEFYERGLVPLDRFPDGIEEAVDEKYKLDKNKKYWVYTGVMFDPRRPWFRSGSGRYQVFVREGDPEFWLSPREALQQYLEKMNQLDVYTWIRKGVEDQLKLATGHWGYNRMRGLVPTSYVGTEGTRWIGTKTQDPMTCFADFRHIPELKFVREFQADPTFRPILVRVKRPSIPVPPYNHRSETEQVKIRDAAFDAVVHNDKDLPHLYVQMDEIVRRAKSGDIPPKNWSEEYVIPDRKPEEGYAP